MNFAYFHALILVGYKFLEGPFTRGSQLSHPKMCKNQPVKIKKKSRDWLLTHFPVKKTLPFKPIELLYHGSFERYHRRQACLFVDFVVLVVVCFQCGVQHLE